MPHGYEINELAKEESWRLFRIIGEMVEGFDRLAGIEPAVTIYGSARVTPDREEYKQAVQIARRVGELGFNIITGGGPGLMEAANKGALEAGVKSVGLNIELPEYQPPNTYSNITISFNHFYIRKVMLVKYASAFIVLPGGLGTLDEVTEVLNLIQTRKIKPFPVILFDSGYWNGFLEWMKNYSLARGYISEEDLTLLRVCDTPEEVVEAVQKWYWNHEIYGRKAVAK